MQTPKALLLSSCNTQQLSDTTGKGNGLVTRKIKDQKQPLQSPSKQVVNDAVSFFHHHDQMIIKINHVRRMGMCVCVCVCAYMCACMNASPFCKHYVLEFFVVSVFYWALVTVLVFDCCAGLMCTSAWLSVVFAYTLGALYLRLGTLDTVIIINL